MAAQIAVVVVASVAALAALVLAGGAFAGSAERASASSSFAHCGDQPHRGAGWYNVRALHTRCDPARALARHYWRTWKRGHPDHRYQGWHCSDRQVGEELWKGKCRRQQGGIRQLVKFQFGF
jgi:hypothetical protein